MWAFGALLFEIFSFSLSPYSSTKDIEQVKYDVLNGKKRPRPPDCPEKVYKIMTACFEFNAAGRPKFNYLHQQLQIIQRKKYSSETEFDY